MTTTANRAAEEGLPELNRRRLLIGLAAASSAAAAVPALAARPTPQSVVEDSELIRLGDEVLSALDAYLLAQALEDERRSEGLRRWPKVPEELFRKDQEGNYRFSGGWMSGEIERGFEGGRVWRKGEEKPRLVYGRYEATGEYQRARGALTNKRLVRTGKLYGRTRAQWEQQLAEEKPLADIAEAYYGECRCIHQDLDWEATWRDEHAKAAALGDLVTKIMAVEARTMEGVIIKGQALAAWGRVTSISRSYHKGMPDWGPMFAADVMRIAAAAA